MKVGFQPSFARGCLSAPPSKSVTHRALLCAALSEGAEVDGLAYSEDVAATLRCLKAMGAWVEETPKGCRLGGLDPYCLPANLSLDCGESGSTLRFLLPLSLLCGHPVTFTGRGRLMQRPMDVYETLCKEQGFLFERIGNQLTVCGRLKGGCYRVSGMVSSQFITGLLFALTLVDGQSIVEITDALESASYIDVTLSVMRHYGVTVTRQGRAFLIVGAQRYNGLSYSIKADCSNAANLEVFNLFGGSVKVNNFTRDTAQGDRIYRQLFADLLRGRSDFDLSDCPDLAPVLFAASAAMDGARFTGVSRLRYKESDRIAAMAEELNKFGIQLTAEENAVTVHKGVLRTPKECLWCHNDHRIGMALSVLCTITGGIVDGAESVAKSYPEFFRDLSALGIQLTISE